MIGYYTKRGHGRIIYPMPPKVKDINRGLLHHPIMNLLRNQRPNNLNATLPHEVDNEFLLLFD